MALVLRVDDYFYDPDFGEEIVISTNLTVGSWLQFCQINNYFFGYPSLSEMGTKTWILLTATDLFGFSAQTVITLEIIDYD